MSQASAAGHAGLTGTLGRAMPRLIAVLLVAPLSLHLPFAPAHAQTLQEALTAAYEDNPQLEAERARLRAVDEQVPQALSGWRPTVRAFGNAGVRQIDSNRESVLGSENALLAPNAVGAEIDQPLFRGGQTTAQTHQAENAVRAEQARLAATEQRVLLDAAVAFVDVFRDQSELALNIRNEQRLDRQLDATRDRFKVGEVTRTDVFQAEARLARATAQRIQAEGRLETSRADYRNVIGRAPGAVERPPLPSSLPATLEEAIDQAIDGNPGLTARAFDERSALDNVDRVRGQLWPTLRLTGRVARDYEATRNDSRLNTYEALVRMDVPLYQAGVVYSQLREAKQSVAEQRRLLDQVHRATVRDATEGWAQLLTARAAIASRNKQVEANQVALQGVQREAEVGSRTVLDILDAEQEVLDSQVDLVRAQRDEVVAAYQLKTALGEMTAERLGLSVRYYDPQRHYHEVRDDWVGGSSSGDIGDDASRTGPVR
ncbi:MAG: TolC family outer membrane protein [Rhodospirillales bacterium]